MDGGVFALEGEVVDGAVFAGDGWRAGFEAAAEGAGHGAGADGDGASPGEGVGLGEGFDQTADGVVVEGEAAGFTGEGLVAGEVGAFDEMTGGEHRIGRLFAGLQLAQGGIEGRDGVFAGRGVGDDLLVGDRGDAGSEDEGGGEVGRGQKAGQGHAVVECLAAKLGGHPSDGKRVMVAGASADGVGDADAFPACGHEAGGGGGRQAAGVDQDFRRGAEVVALGEGGDLVGPGDVVDRGGDVEFAAGGGGAGQAAEGAQAGVVGGTRALAFGEDGEGADEEVRLFGRVAGIREADHVAAAAGLGQGFQRGDDAVAAGGAEVAVDLEGLDVFGGDAHRGEGAFVAQGEFALGEGVGVFRNADHVGGGEGQAGASGGRGGADPQRQAAGEEGPGDLVHFLLEPRVVGVGVDAELLGGVELRLVEAGGVLRGVADAGPDFGGRGLAAAGAAVGDLLRAAADGGADLGEEVADGLRRLLHRLDRVFDDVLHRGDRLFDGALEAFGEEVALAGFDELADGFAFGDAALGLRDADRAEGAEVAVDVEVGHEAVGRDLVADAVGRAAQQLGGEEFGGGQDHAALVSGGGLGEGGGGEREAGGGEEELQVHGGRVGLSHYRTSRRRDSGKRGFPGAGR